MRKSQSLLLVSALFCMLLAPARAASPWLTVVGDVDDAASDTVQVDPTLKAVNGELRSMAIRVNRASMRTSPDGVLFRSYIAQVEFNCLKAEARFQTVSYFLSPLWHGVAHRTVVFTPANARLMRFRDMDPNPVERIVRAACMAGRAS